MVIHDVVVNDHAVGNTVRRVLAAGPLDVVDFCTVGHVNELESIASSNPNHVGSDISCGPVTSSLPPSSTPLSSVKGTNH